MFSIDTAEGEFNTGGAFGDTELRRALALLMGRHR
jgi:hypothetical protein